MEIVFKTMTGTFEQGCQPINVCSVHLFVKQMWTWKCNNLDRPMVKNDDKNDDHDHEMSGFTFEILMSITSKYYQKFMPELLTAIHDR